MKKILKNKKIMAVFTTCFLFMVSVMPIFADVGNHSSYSSSSSGDSDIFWILFLLIDTFGFSGTIIILVVGYCIYSYLKKNGVIDTLKELQTTEPKQSYISESTIINSIQKTDPYFDSAKFKSKVSNMYVSLQEAWEEKDWRKARPFESDYLFAMHSKQLNEYIQKQQTNVMDRICVNGIDIISYEEYPNSRTAQIKVKIKSSQIDYIKDDKTNRIITGNSKIPMNCTYQWTLVRSLDVKSDASVNGIESTCCPSCGAPLSINMGGTCEYCNATVTSGQYDWVLNEIRKLN